MTTQASSAKFIKAMMALHENQQGFERGEVSSLKHSRARGKRLGQAIAAMAEEMGVHLVVPINIMANGDFPINVDTRAGSSCYGEEFATLLNAYSPRCGMAAAAVLFPEGSWCFLSHFAAEKMVKEHFKTHPMRPQESDDQVDAPQDRLRG